MVVDGLFGVKVDSGAVVWLYDGALANETPTVEGESNATN